MPAICGYVRRHHRALAACQAIERMTHPDETGAWHRQGELLTGDGRVAVRSWQLGAHPPVSAAGDEGLVIDGYLLNRDEVAGLSGAAATGLSDAQLLRRLWRRQGHKMLPLLEGDFNLVAVDDSSVVLASSRLGSRHLYWRVCEEYIAFATRISALVRLPGLPQKVDRQALQEMFNFGYIGGDRSPVQGIRLLPPGACVCIGARDLVERRYWQMTFDEPTPAAAFDDLVDEAIEAYAESVALFLRRFEHVTIPISGGLDSRTLLAFAARRRQGIDVHHCSWYEGEAHIARCLARVCRANWHEHDPLGFDYASILAEGMQISQGCVHSHQFWFLPVARALASAGKADVVLDGYLMDVMFADTFLILPERGGVSRADTHRIINRLWRRCRPGLVRQVFLPSFYEEYEEVNRQSIDEQLDTIDEDLISRRIHQFSFKNRSNRYSVALPNVQRQHIDYGYPGTTRRLLDLYGRIPPASKAGARFARAVLERAAPAAAAVPWAKTGRPLQCDKTRFDRLLERLPLRQLGTLFLLRATAGRVDVSHRADLNRHFRRQPGFRRAHLDVVEDERTFERGIIDRDGLRRLVSMIDRGWPVFFLLQALVTTEMFQRRFIDGD